MNLPNAITVGRIVAAPFVAVLPFSSAWELRLAGFLLFVVVAWSDYYDGMLARSRNLITDLGKQLDPLADKLFLVATFVPMYLLMEASRARDLGVDGGGIGTLTGALVDARWFPFLTPFGRVGMPLWVVIVVLGREVLMTVFRQLAARRGVVIAAIGPAKWKTGLQLVWVGAAFFWFWAATLAAGRGWDNEPWRLFAYFNGTVGVVTMIGAIALTLYSLGLYLHRYGAVLVRPAVRAGK